MKVIVYQSQEGKEPYRLWLSSLKDKTIKLRIIKRVQRLDAGYFGDSKYLGDGIHELRLFFGAGYRVYFGKEREQMVILLCGGDKSSQSKDIKLAKEYWKDYLEDRHATIH